MATIIYFSYKTKPVIMGEITGFVALTYCFYVYVFDSCYYYRLNDLDLRTHPQTLHYQHHDCYCDYSRYCGCDDYDHVCYSFTYPPNIVMWVCCSQYISCTNSKYLCKLLILFCCDCSGYQ